MTRIDKACYERGCACYDDRVDGDAVEVVLAQTQEPVSSDPLPRACNLAGVDYQTFLKIKAYMPVAPPQRTWVGLTDEEILSAARDHYNPYQRPEISFARAIEAKLKEKNT